MNGARVRIGRVRMKSGGASVRVIDRPPEGRIVRAGTLDQVAGQVGLEQAFLDAVGSGPVERELSWFAS